jgi:hypothetical protein
MRPCSGNRTSQSCCRSQYGTAMPRRRHRVLNEGLVTCAHLLQRAILLAQPGQVGIRVGEQAMTGLAGRASGLCLPVPGCRLPTLTLSSARARFTYRQRSRITDQDMPQHTTLSLLPAFRKQHLNIEFASLRSARLEGVFVSITPSDPSLWVGVIFVRRGN